MHQKNYKIKELTLPEMQDIYQGPAVNHFPANERKPYKAIERMYYAGCYEGLGLFEEGNLVAYAFFVQTKDKQIRLLDYYAVLEAYRSSGVGSIFLGKMKEWYKENSCILLETEDLALALNEEERQLRSRRNAFYLKNGVRETDIHVSYFAADYQIFYLPLREVKTEQQVFEKLKQIYRVMFGEKTEELVKYRAS